MSISSGPQGPLPDPSILEGVSTPPFVRLPEPATLFATRAERLDLLGQTSDLKPYLSFVGDLARAQASLVSDLPEPELPDAAALALAASHGMPALDHSRFTADAAFEIAFDRFLAAAEPIAMPEPARAALGRVAGASAVERDALVRNVLADTIPPDAVAEHVYAACVLQVHFAARAARLDPAALVPVGDALCPCCGGRPAVSLVVNWPKAHGARYCACALCGTWWNYVRVRCTACGSTKGIGYQEPEGGQGAIKAETCDACHAYCKVLYLTVAHDMEPLADDVASLGLDMLMRESPYHRAAFNPFLFGY